MGFRFPLLFLCSFTLQSSWALDFPTLPPASNPITPPTPTAMVTSDNGLTTAVASFIKASNGLGVVMSDASNKLSDTMNQTTTVFGPALNNVANSITQAVNYASNDLPPLFNRALAVVEPQNLALTGFIVGACVMTGAMVAYLFFREFPRLMKEFYWQRKLAKRPFDMAKVEEIGKIWQQYPEWRKLEDPRAVLGQFEVLMFHAHYTAYLDERIAERAKVAGIVVKDPESLELSKEQDPVLTMMIKLRETFQTFVSQAQMDVAGGALVQSRAL